MIRKKKRRRKKRALNIIVIGLASLALGYGVWLVDKSLTHKDVSLTSKVKEKREVSRIVEEKKRPLLPKGIIHPSRKKSTSQRIKGKRVIVSLPKEMRKELRAKKECKVRGLPPRIAIIIDDLANGGEVTNLLWSIKSPLTIAILPQMPDSSSIAKKAFDKNIQVVLHLPLESENSQLSLGPGGITCQMDEKEISKQVRDNLESIPHVVGINNHMGSRATADPRVMQAVLEVAKQKGLFFVDSLTTPKSLAFKVAKGLKVETAKREVFLDGKLEQEYIRSQINLLAKVAKKKGKAIGVGHINQKTIEVIKEMIPQLEEEGIEFVYADQLVD